MFYKYLVSIQVSIQNGLLTSINHKFENKVARFFCEMKSDSNGDKVKNIPLTWLAINFRYQLSLTSTNMT